ncbi:MAG: tetratricopeptide repeat protein [Fidelibacterota bacterium]|nr:MAG: tetratricopeptide repeat protein [Candidatus Neomarinimicrobiota bacterium]
MRLVLTIALSFMTGLLWGQQPLWEQLIEQGNQALANGAFFEAETYYRQALQVTDQFTPQDLRKATTRRNLAQALMLQGHLEPADSLYRDAISIATRSLGVRHTYVLTLQEELALLRQTMAAAQLPESVPQQPTSWEDILAQWLEWLARNSALQLGATIPLSDSLAQSNERGLTYGLSVHIPLTTLGAIDIGLGVEHVITKLPPKHTLDVPIPMQGTSLLLVPSHGPLILTFGGGVYNINISQAPEARLGLQGGIGLSIRGRHRRSGVTGLLVAMHVRGLYLPDLAPVIEGPVTLLQAGLVLGWAW